MEGSRGSGTITREWEGHAGVGGSRGSGRIAREWEAEDGDWEGSLAQWLESCCGCLTLPWAVIELSVPVSSPGKQGASNLLRTPCKSETKTTTHSAPHLDAVLLMSTRTASQEKAGTAGRAKEQVRK